MQLRDVVALDVRSCAWLNRASGPVAVRTLFAVISRAGDGIAWYALMLLLPALHGVTGLVAALHLAATGAAGLLMYRAIKARTTRPRPYRVHRSIRARIAPLDRYSFPSGHTLHAVSFTLVAAAYFPASAVVLVPFAILVALSRPVLGLHYPSDVIVGALLGWGIGSLSLAVGMTG